MAKKKATRIKPNVKRIEYAKVALVGLLAAGQTSTVTGGDPAKYARMAFKYADAMAAAEKIDFSAEEFETVF